MKALLSLIISTALVVSGYAQTRNVLVGTNNAVVQPTNFWSADASNARSGLGLGTAATNPSSAFQPSSSILSNLVSGGSLTFSNITVGISNVTGLQTALDGKLGTNPTLAIANISNLQTTLDGKLGTNPTLQISNIAALQIALDGKLSGTFPIAISNVSGLQTSLDGKLGTNPTLAIANITGLQTNLDSKLSLTGNAVNLTNFPASLLRTTGDASGLTNFPTLNQNTTGTASNVTGVVAVSNGGTGTNSAIGARANLGLSWSGLTNATAETFRTALGLGSFSTLSAAAISNVTGLQAALDDKLASNGNAINLTNFPTSLLRVDGSAAALTNFPASLLRTTGDASNLTNFPILNQNTTGTASNVTGIVSITNGGSGANTASGARTALGLGTAATNPASAFQPSSTVLSNLANNNGSSLTNITAANIGTVALASNITGTAPLATNVTGVVALANGGTGATNAAGARTALGVGAADVFVGLTNMGVGTNQGFASSPYILGSTNSTAPNNAVAALGVSTVRDLIGALATNGNGAGVTNLTAANIAGTVGLASNITGTVVITNGGSGATTAGEARTNFGLGWSALTNTNTSTSLLGFTANGQVVANTANALHFTNDNIAFNVGDLSLSNGAFFYGGQPRWAPEDNSFDYPLAFNGSNTAATTRTNLGLGWSALTNTNSSAFQTALFGSGTNPVLVATNGEVVSPTNFWQAAPITTTFIESQPTTNSSTNISASRLLHIHSLSTNIVNVTNTIVLPTNTLTFEGDMALVVHKGSTNSLTQVRQAGSTNNIITINKFNEAVEFTYYNDTWQFLETAAFTAPIYFSGTNASVNAAASRTNLGLGSASAVTFATVAAQEIFNSSGEKAIDLENFSLGYSNTSVLDWTTNQVSVYVPMVFSGTNVAATTRTNLGIPLEALTNTSVTNFQKAIFYTNTAPSNIGGNLGTIAAWIEIVASNGVTYKVPAYTNVP